MQPPWARPLRWLLLPAPWLLAGLATSPAAWAQGAASDPVAADSVEPPLPSAPAPTRAALPPLPEVPRARLAPPTAEERSEAREALDRLCAADAGARDQARRELLELSPRLVAALDARLDELADSGEKTRLRQRLERIRREARREARGRRPPGEDGPSIDWLAAALEQAEPEAREWCDVVHLLGAIRALTAMGTTEAVRELVDVYVRFGEMARIDVQLRLAELGERAVPALLEARRHKAEKVGRWAARQLDALGKAIPGETVRTKDATVLADVLLAYGRTRDLDALRLVVSFANSERLQVREAARQAVVLYGEAGTWQLRESYESTVGKRPPRDWAWDRVARELFAELDRLRLARVVTRFEQGLAARAAGDLEGMQAAFDEVLARSPAFERRAEMAAGYAERARALADTDRSLARLLLSRAERLTPAADARAPLESLRLTLEAEELEERGLVDLSLLRRAVELDGSNRRAAARLSRWSTPPVDARAQRAPWVLAGLMGALALGGALLLLLRRGSARARVEPAAALPSAFTAEPAPAEAPARSDDGDAAAKTQEDGTTGDPIGAAPGGDGARHAGSEGSGASAPSDDAARPSKADPGPAAPVDDAAPPARTAEGGTAPGERPRR